MGLAPFFVLMGWPASGGFFPGRKKCCELLVHGRLGDVVGVIGQRFDRDAQHDLERLGAAETRLHELSQGRFRNTPAMPDHGLRRAAQRLEPVVGQRAVLLQADDLGSAETMRRGQRSVGRGAVLATVLHRDRQQHDLALERRQVDLGRIERAEQAVEAVMHLLWKRGFPSVSASNMASAMSITRSSFCNSFGSRESGFQEAFDRYVSSAPDAVLDRVAPGEAVLPVLAGLLREVCRVRAADPEGRGCLICNSVTELVGVDRALGPLLQRAVRMRLDGLEQRLEQAARQGEFARPPDFAAAAHVYLSFLMGLNTICKVVRSKSELWSMCAEFLLGFGVPRAVVEAS